MSQKTKSGEVVVVLGGTGTIGQHLVPRLCSSLFTPDTEPALEGERGQAAQEVPPQHVVRVVTRDVDKAREQFQALDVSYSNSNVTLEIVRGDVEDLDSLRLILVSATRLFLLTLTSLTHRQVAVERGILSLLGLPSDDGSAVGATVKHVVRLSAHSRCMEGQPSNSPFRWHSECDEQLLRACDRHAGSCHRDVAVTLLRPSLFLQDMTRRHFAPLIRTKDTFHQLGAAHYRDGDYGTAPTFEDCYRIAMVDARDIADVAACALSEAVDKHASNTYILSGPRALLWSDVATAISRACGRQVNAVLLGDKAFTDQFGGSHVYLKQMQAYRAGYGQDVDGDIEVVTGRPARSLEQFCSDYADCWRR